MSIAPPVSGQADPEELLPYLTAAQREILLFLGDEYAGEVHPVTADDLQAAVDDRGAHGSVQTAVESLIEWRLAEGSGTLGEDGDRVRGPRVDRPVVSRETQACPALDDGTPRPHAQRTGRTPRGAGGLTRRRRG